MGPDEASAGTTGAIEIRHSSALLITLALSGIAGALLSAMFILNPDPSAVAVSIGFGAAGVVVCGLFTVWVTRKLASDQAVITLSPEGLRDRARATLGAARVSHGRRRPGNFAAASSRSRW
jgi:ABC-type uncharacterized transport system permease subunit